MKTQDMIVREYISSHTLQALAGFYILLFSEATLEKLESEDGPITDQERASWEAAHASSEEFARQATMQMGIQGVTCLSSPERQVMFQVPVDWVTNVGLLLRETKTELSRELRGCWMPFVRKVLGERVFFEILGKIRRHALLLHRVEMLIPGKDHAVLPNRPPKFFSGLIRQLGEMKTLDHRTERRRDRHDFEVLEGRIYIRIFGNSQLLRRGAHDGFLSLGVMDIEPTAAEI